MDTPLTLLERLRGPADSEAWSRFVQLYTPLLLHWARGTGLQQADAADLVQDVFTLLIQKLPEFTYNRHGSFRGWLRTVTLNKWREGRRRSSLPLAGPEHAADDVTCPDPAEAFWEQEYRQHLVAQALRVIQSEFHATTWKACWEYVSSDKSAATVAAELGLTPGAVRAAKFRVLNRLREFLADFLD